MLKQRLPRKCKHNPPEVPEMLQFLRGNLFLSSVRLCLPQGMETNSCEDLPVLFKHGEGELELFNNTDELLHCGGIENLEFRHHFSEKCSERAYPTLSSPY